MMVSVPKTDNAKTYLIKSSWEHASIGLDEELHHYYTSKAKILKEMNYRKEKLGGSCYAEAYIDGREFNVALIPAKMALKFCR